MSFATTHNYEGEANSMRAPTHLTNDRFELLGEPSKWTPQSELEGNHSLSDTGEPGAITPSSHICDLPQTSHRITAYARVHDALLVFAGGHGDRIGITSISRSIGGSGHLKHRDGGTMCDGFHPTRLGGSPECSKKSSC